MVHKFTQKLKKTQNTSYIQHCVLPKGFVFPKGFVLPKGFVFPKGFRRSLVFWLNLIASWHGTTQSITIPYTMPFFQ